MYIRRSPYPPSILGEHAGHEIVVDIHRHELPAVAITTCKTCHKELERQQLPIRVIAYGHMCFGDGKDNRYLELMPTAFFVRPDHAPHGDQYTPELRAFIGKEASSLLSQLEMSTVKCTFDLHNGTVLSEPALLIEPVAIPEDAQGYERDAAERFETLWQAHSNPDQVDEAMAAMPLVRRLLQRYHDSYYDLAINQDPQLGAESPHPLHCGRRDAVHVLQSHRAGSRARNAAGGRPQRMVGGQPATDRGRFLLAGNGPLSCIPYIAWNHSPHDEPLRSPNRQTSFPPINVYFNPAPPGRQAVTIGYKTKEHT